MTHDDDGWLTGLAGRRIDEADATQVEAAREGRLMREALMRWGPAVDPLHAADPDHLARLLERARAAGLFDERVPPVAPPSPSGRVRAWWTAARSPRAGARWAMAVVVVAVVATAYVLRPGHELAPDDETVRAAPDAVTLLRATDPEALRTEIVDALSRQGVRSSTYARFGRVGIDADVPVPVSNELKAVLARYRIPPPVDGVLRVEIEAAR